MGQFFSAGLLTKIYINKKNSWRSIDNYYIKENLQSILNDTSKYEITFNEDSVCLQLDLNYVNKHLHDLLIEMSKIHKKNSFVNSIIDSDTLDTENYVHEQEIKCNEKYDRYCMDTYYGECYENYLDYPLYWINTDRKIIDNVEVSGSYIPIWHDLFKVFMEDSSFVLMILNKAKNSYFESELSKCLIFEIV